MRKSSVRSACALAFVVLVIGLAGLTPSGATAVCTPATGLVGACVYANEGYGYQSAATGVTISGPTEAHVFLVCGSALPYLHQAGYGLDVYQSNVGHLGVGLVVLPISNCNAS